MRLFTVLFSLLMLASCSGNDQKAVPGNVPAAIAGNSANPMAFNLPFDTLLIHYYSLGEALAAESAPEIIHTRSNALMRSVDSLPVEELRADTTMTNTIISYTLSISSELKGLVGEPGMLEKRKEFGIISEQLYELIKTVKYDRTVIYHIYCPTAFSDQGAYWLNNTRNVRNPYTPQKAMGCGEIKDSIDFRHKSSPGL